MPLIHRKINENKVNVLLFDFISFQPEIVHYLISSNIKKTLKILCAFFNGVSLDIFILNNYIT